MAKGMLVEMALEAVREIIAAHGRSQALSVDFEHAHTSLVGALRTADDRAALLERLAAAHAEGAIPTAAYQQLLVTIGRLLKGSADLAKELERVTRPGRP